MTLQDFLNTYKFDPNNDLINEGGFGKIYRAWGEHDREVVLKACPLQKTKYSLKREFEIASKLSQHPNIAYYESVHEFDVPGIGKMEYAVMQYYPEGDLKKVLANYSLSIEDKKDILRGILDGISFLHKSNVIHRDLKPGNILMQKVQGKWRPKITDFGLGKQYTASGEISNTSAGILSLLYASPEQIFGKTTLPNTDLWPIGIITYQLFTGENPFQSDLPKDTESYRADVTKKITTGILPDKINKIPDPFKEIIKQCLVQNPEMRVKTADDLIAIIDKSEIPLIETTEIINKEIDNEKTTIQEEAPKPELAPNSPSSLVKQRKKKKWILLTIISLIAATILVYLFAFVLDFSSKKDPEIVAEEFLTHLAMQEFEEARLMATGDALEMVNTIQSFNSLIDEDDDLEKPDITAMKCDVHLNTAKCTYRQDGTKNEISLTEIDGKWLVSSFPKEGSSDEDSDEDEDNDDNDDYSSSTYEDDNDDYDSRSSWQINEDGVENYNAGYYSSAKRFFVEAHNQNYTPATRNLGIYYMTIEEDYDDAYYYLKMAADKYDADAMHNLSIMYKNGYVNGYVEYDEAEYWEDRYEMYK